MGFLTDTEMLLTITIMYDEGCDSWTPCFTNADTRLGTTLLQDWVEQRIKK